MKHEEYLKRRDEFLGIRMDSFSSFDKAILSLATGSLALSITFIDKIGKPFNRLTFSLIILSWFFFFIVILFNLASFYFARANMDKKIEELDDRYRKELETKKEDIGPEITFWHKKATSICNSGAFISFFMGVLFFVVYIVNIQVRNYREYQFVERKDNIMPETKQIMNEGKTESPKAVTTTTIQSGKINTHGATESPQAVLQPKPDEGSSGGSKKSE